MHPALIGTPGIIPKGATMPYIDPWAGFNQGLQAVGSAVDDVRNQQRVQVADARNAEMQGLQMASSRATLADLAAQRGALQKQYAPGGTLEEAYANQGKMEQQQKALEAEQKGFQTYLNTIGVLDKMNLDPKSKTDIGKEFLKQNPKYAPLADNLTFIDSKGVKAARQFAAGELKDPVTGQPLPAGYYETEGVWTGDATNPVKLTNYKLVEEKPAYKDRTRTVGDQTVFEESQDGGRTWKKVSSGARYKPGDGHGDGGGGDDAAAWAKAIKDGRANLQDVPSRGTIRSQVVKMIERGGGTDYAANKADNAAFSASITQQQKAVGSMGSFVKNMDAQIAKVGQLSKDLSTFDTRLLNMPLRAVRGRIAGSPQQAKYDMYLTEIESEIGKLATGSAGSVSELSVGAQEKWAKIHDKNLSIKDMMELLKETSHAGKLRMKSVQDQLNETRAQQRSRGGKVAPTTNVSDPLGLRS
jgi:hypothetical protein